MDYEEYPPIRFTGLWIKKDHLGNSYLKGGVNCTMDLIIEENLQKTKDTDPDWVAFYQHPKNSTKHKYDKEKKFLDK